MRRFLGWCIGNSRAVYVLVVAVLLLGTMAFFRLRRETFPEFQLDIVLVSVPYPGASPSEIEDSICRKIEEAVRSLEGIEKITSVAREGAGSVICELSAGVRDPQKVLNEIKSEVDRIPTFPEFAEEPDIRQITLREPAVRVAVLGGAREGEMAERDLRAVAEQVRSELLQLPSGPGVTLEARPYQIDVEIPETTLQKYNLTLSQVAMILRDRNLDMPAGHLRTENSDYLMRGKNKLLDGREIGQLPLLTTPEGTVLTVSDVGVVRDGFLDETTSCTVNGKPALVLVVSKTSQQDLIEICKQVREFVRDSPMPDGYSLEIFADSSRMVQERLSMLGTNALQGLLIVFVTLALFLDIRLAFWVAMGIPVAVLGACAVMLATDQTLNMISLFAFIMVLGIVVDDAIVMSENVHVHRQRGKSPVRAAIDGVAEVFPSIASSVAIATISVLPMFFVSGVMGKFIAVMPVAIIATLIISLFETTICFPTHLSHLRDTPRIPRVLRFLGIGMLYRGWTRISNAVDRGLHRFIDRQYVPALRFVLRHPALSYSGMLFFLLGTWGLVLGGLTPFVYFPKLDSDYLQCSVVYPKGTPGAVTQESIDRIEAAALKVHADLLRETGEDVVKFRYCIVGSAEDPMRPEPLEGSNVGQVFLEILPGQDRQITSDEFLLRWREASGEFPGLDSPPNFATPVIGPQDVPIEFKLLCDDLETLKVAVAKAKARLAEFDGVFDVSDDAKPGNWEILLKIRPEAQALGLTEADLYQTMRDAFYGAEVTRLQRGRHEVKLMVRYPEEDRRSLATLGEVRVRTPAGDEIPLMELAEIHQERGYAEINRVGQVRCVTISADVDEGSANASQIVQSLKSDFLPGLLAEHPEVRVRWEGQQQQSEESLASMGWGYAIAIAANFILLTIEFKSYSQAFIILLCIPLGTAGAIIGHLFWGLPITMFSMFGLVALAGIAVNEAIVMVDWINRLRADGMPIEDALIRAGRDRFRAILLTSTTTVGGLLPLLFYESSFQGQLLVPMAITISFGPMTSTTWTLFITPLMYQSWHRLTSRGKGDRDDLTFVQEEESEIQAATMGEEPIHGPRSIRRPASVGLRRRLRSPANS